MFDIKMCDNCKQPVIQAGTITVNQQPALDGNIRLTGGEGKLRAEKLNPMEAFQAQQDNELLYEEHQCKAGRPWSYERIMQEKERFRERWIERHGEERFVLSLSRQELTRVNAILSRSIKTNDRDERRQMRYNIVYALFPETIKWEDPSTTQLRSWQENFIAWLWPGEKVNGSWKSHPHQAQEARAVLKAYARLEREKLKELGQMGFA